MKSGNMRWLCNVRGALEANMLRQALEDEGIFSRSYAQGAGAVLNSAFLFGFDIQVPEEQYERAKEIADALLGAG